MNTRHAWLYVSGYDINTVFIYDLSEPAIPQIGSITDDIANPLGLAVDTYGTLYVANSAAHTVTEYALGSTSPSLTLSVPGTPQSVAVDTTGTVYVCIRGRSAKIAVYARWQTSPSSHITSSLFRLPNQVVLDGQHDLYISDNESGILELPQGSQTVESLGLNFMGEATGLALGPVDGSIYVSAFEVGTGFQIDRFLSGTTDPAESIPITYAANFIAAGFLKGKQMVFAPESDGTDVYAYNRALKKPNKFMTPSSEMEGAFLKPAGAL